MKNITLPLSEEQLTNLKITFKDLNSQQLAWLSGYLWSLSSNETSTSIASEENISTVQSPVITILSASQTGNARKIAEQLHIDLERAGFNTSLIKTGEYKPKQISKENLLLIITSTQGEGEPPEEALAFYKYIFSKKAPKLENVKYAVLGLGDSSYEFFCKAGKDIDEKLSDLGAQRILERTDADVYFQPIADEWRQKITDSISQHITTKSNIQTKKVKIDVESSVYTKENPFNASISVNQKITARQSEKDVRLLEIDLGESELHYQPGDALGIWYLNNPELVSEIITILSLDKDTPVTWEGKSISLYEALTSYYELTQNNRVIASKYSEFSEDSEFKILISDSSRLADYVKKTSLVDMIHQFPAKLSAEEFLSCLRPLTPRLYSIASSQKEVENEVHITVGVVSFEADGKKRTGGASGYLSSLQEGDEIKIFIEPNDRFRLPTDGATPIIMIGSGTGIAPYRAFMQQREAEEATGKNWIFFGNPHFTSDFLYQVEWQQYVKTGLLTKIDLAWSRDQAEKIYVQDKIKEKSAEIWKWIKEGSYIYVCGDASKMAKDVEDSLVEIVKKEGNMKQEEAEDFIDTLRSELRYQRDIY